MDVSRYYRWYPRHGFQNMGIYYFRFITSDSMVATYTGCALNDSPLFYAADGSEWILRFLPPRPGHSMKEFELHRVRGLRVVPREGRLKVRRVSKFYPFV